MKKLIFSLALITFTSILSAKSFRFSCPYDVPEQAQGSYLVEGRNKYSITYSINNQKIDILKKLPAEQKTSDPFIRFFNSSNYPGLLETDFVRFDNKGNFYLIGSLYNFQTKNHTTILKYNPIENTAVFFTDPENSIPESFAISDDGRWIFFNSTYYTDQSEDLMKSKVYIIDTQNPENWQLLFEDKMPGDYSYLYNLCFDSNTKNLYFSNLGWNRIYNTHFRRGLFILRPENGEYVAKNLESNISYEIYQINKLLNSYLIPDDQKWDFILQEMKEISAVKDNPDDIIITLEGFKNIQNDKYKPLYKEDKNGKALTEIDALKYLFNENYRLFQDYVYEYYDNNNFEIVNEISNFLPLELISINKQNGKPAYNINQDFFKSAGFIDAGYLFSNKQGLWLNQKIFDGETESYLIQLTDNKGNFITAQNSELAQIKLQSIYDAQKDILYGDDYVIFIPKEKDKIYMFKDNKLTDLSDRFPDESVFSYIHLQMLKNQFEKPASQNEIDTAKDKRVIIHLAVAACLIAILLVISIILFILLRKNNSVILKFFAKKQLKEQKKFIFDIQEQERGKISRDVHDSIIQDIRSIRLNTEMLKVSEDSELRKQNIITLATNCVVTLRNICYNLTPAELSTHSDGDNSKIELISIIQTLVTQFIEKTHVPCSIQIEQNFTYPVFEKEVSQNLFRIIQESLTNIEKHSYATQCSIFIKSKRELNKDYMVIYISDDGIGCDIQNLLKRKRKLHFGLQNIQDRAELIGSKVEFRSEPGDGMEIIITVPIN